MKYLGQFSSPELPRHKRAQNFSQEKLWARNWSMSIVRHYNFFGIGRDFLVEMLSFLDSVG